MDADDKELKYQRETKMFYGIALTGVLIYSIKNELPLTTFAKRLNKAHNVLCVVTESWIEDERYKRDPRWHT